MMRPRRTVPTDQRRCRSSPSCRGRPAVAVSALPARLAGIAARHGSRGRGVDLDASRARRLARRPCGRSWGGQSFSRFPCRRFYRLESCQRKHGQDRKRNGKKRARPLFGGIAIRAYLRAYLTPKAVCISAFLERFLAISKSRNRLKNSKMQQNAKGEVVIMSPLL